MSPRLDRFATLYLVSPLLCLATSRRFSIPILMFHSIADEEDSRNPYYRTTTSPAAFAAQMKQLYAEGYSTCTLAQALDQLQQNVPIAPKPVVITFDDGYSDFRSRAFPVLTKYDFSATMFLPTAYICESPTMFKGKACLTWAEVRELKQHGIEIGSHTVTHPQLHDLSPSVINDEIVNSKNAIEQRLGCRVDSFAYPFAFPQTDTGFTATLRESLLTAGYKNGVCTMLGRADRWSEPLFLERLPVNTCDDSRLFRAKLAGAYDWIAKPQYLAKFANSRAGRGVWQANKKAARG
jgi:peptidoglycan/xylan/chitin deacetylase (PgdA/CDA1 family)